MEKKRLTIGIVAHVDAGKTTLSEEILYIGGNIRTKGRVDHGDALFDFAEMEKKRGITVYSKEAKIELKNAIWTLLDTPGHLDFTAEMERTLSVLDYAILVISAPDGVQQHTKDIWKLLHIYDVPTFIFLNKMDRAGVTKESALEKLISGLTFDGKEPAILPADSDYFDSGAFTDEEISEAIDAREIFPCVFGTALKGEGVNELCDIINRFAREPEPETNAFGARVYKITRDKSKNRLTHMKIVSGRLSAKDVISGEKVDQIRIYNGPAFDMVATATAGEVIVASGLAKTYAGQGIGTCEGDEQPFEEPKDIYEVLLRRGESIPKVMNGMQELEEENPTLHVYWDSIDSKLYIMAMGLLELEMVKSSMESRYQISLEGFNKVDAIPEHTEIEIELELPEEERHLVMPERYRDLSRLSGDKELDAIFRMTYGVSKKDEQRRREQRSKSSRARATEEAYSYKQAHKKPTMPNGEKLTVIDGYNLLFAWPNLSELVRENIDAAREVMIDHLENYAGFTGDDILVVFDGYKRPGNSGSNETRGTLKVVFTREAVTADRYIEDTIFKTAKKRPVLVVTSDRPVQMAALGDGATRLSAREFVEQVSATEKEISKRL